MSSAAHAAHAAAYDETADPRACHLAAAAVGPDEKIAAALEDAAARAAARGGLETAARTYERAAGLTADSDVRGQRLLAAAMLAHTTGRLGSASDLVSALPLASTATVRADFRHLAAALERERGSVRRARMMLWDSAATIADEDPTRATLMLIDATSAEMMSGDLVAAAESAQRAVEHARSCASAIKLGIAAHDPRHFADAQRPGRAAGSQQRDRAARKRRSRAGARRRRRSTARRRRGAPQPGGAEQVKENEIAFPGGCPPVGASAAGGPTARR